MKSYTDIEQSKVLSKILPLESADMSYQAYREEGGISDYQATLCPHRFASWIGIPCWSLSALLELIKNSVGSNVTFELVYLPSTTNGRGEHLNETFRFSVDDIFTEMDIYEKEPIDAVYSMVVWLSENKKT